MLYSSSSFQHEKAKPQGTDSSLIGDRIYNGGYWDEFGLTQFQNMKPKILILGAGHGACIRPILAQNPQASILLIDVDAFALQNLKEIYSNEFPQVTFQTQHADAATFKIPHSSFDGIWIDLYSNEGFIPFSFSEEFLIRCRDGLKQEGHLFFNVFSAPCYYDFYSRDPRVNDLRSKFFKIFKNIYSFPHRRNFTLVGSNAEQNKKKINPVHKFQKSLSTVDQLMNKMHHLRWSAAQVDSGEKTDAASDFTFIGIRKYFKEAASLRELSLLVQDLAEFSATLLNNSSAEGPEINQLIARAKVILGKDPITFTKWLLPLLGSCLASYQNPPANLLQEFQHILCSLESQNV